MVQYAKKPKKHTFFWNVAKFSFMYFCYEKMFADWLKKLWTSQNDKYLYIHCDLENVCTIGHHIL